MSAGSIHIYNVKVHKQNKHVDTTKVTTGERRVKEASHFLQRENTKRNDFYTITSKLLIFHYIAYN